MPPRRAALCQSAVWTLEDNDFRGGASPFVLDGPINGECFKAYVEKAFVPTLSEGDIALIAILARTRVRKSG